MAKRVVIETSLYYDENIVNYVVIHPEDSMFSLANRVEILNKYDFFKFEIILKPTVKQGAIVSNCLKK
jgi:hypothetical protein